MKRRVVITGMGALSPIGNTVSEMWQAARQGVCGIGTITRYDASHQQVHLAAELKNFCPEDWIDPKKLRKMSRFSQLALVAAKQAFEQSGLVMDKENPLRCGVNVSSGIGGLDTIEQEHSRGIARGFDRVSSYFIPSAISNMAAGLIAIELGFKGSCTAVVTACASGTNAIGEAFRAVRDGYADVMLCGGTEASITPLGVGGFTSLQALSQSKNPLRASIPFDKERSGFVMGEGAGILILEEYEHAKARGAAIFGEVAGYAATCDAHHVTAPPEDGAGAAACMALALQDADLAPKDIGYLNAHGTSTPMNDRCETRAIRSVFGKAADTLAVSSTKSMTGHMLGASGAVEAILTACALQDGFLPPTIGYAVPDEACDLDIVPNVGREKAITAAMSNSLGFGGHNATLVLRRASPCN